MSLLKFLLAVLIYVSFSKAIAQDLCESHGQFGNTIEEAEKACVRHRAEARWLCNRNATCVAGVAVCESKGYKGSSITKAIDACFSLSYEHSRETCAQDVTCH